MAVTVTATDARDRFDPDTLIADDTRVEIVAGDLRGEFGFVRNWWLSFGSLVYSVELDGGGFVPALPSQLVVAE